jgi:hypothetical protein
LLAEAVVSQYWYGLVPAAGHAQVVTGLEGNYQSLIQLGVCYAIEISYFPIAFLVAQVFASERAQRVAAAWLVNDKVLVFCDDSVSTRLRTGRCWL